MELMGEWTGSSHIGVYREKEDEVKEDKGGVAIG